LNLEQRISTLEQTVASLADRASNFMSRGTLTATADDSPAQEATALGFYGEELDGVTNWQPFGMAASCPPGGDVLMMCLGGNRDGAQIVSVSHPDYRPTAGQQGGNIVYDAFGNKITLSSEGIAMADVNGNTVTLDAGGITIKDAAGNTVTLAGAAVSITSGNLDHNGTNVGDTHVHGGIAVGLLETKAPQ